MIEKEMKLINAYRKYIYFLSKAYDDVFTFANVHGYNCRETEIKIGQQLRDDIQKLEKEYKIPDVNFKECL